MKLDLLKAEFDKWWRNEGNKMRPTRKEDIDDFICRIAETAWLTGGIKFNHIVEANKKVGDEYNGGI